MSNGTEQVKFALPMITFMQAHQIRILPLL